MKKNRFVHILFGGTKDDTDIRWLCGVQPPENALFIRNGRGKILLVSEMEYNRIRRTAAADVRVLFPPPLSSSWMKSAVKWIQTEIRPRRLTVTPWFPAGIAEMLRNAGFEIQISRKPVCKEREIKTPDEIKAIRSVQRAAGKAMTAAIREIAESVPGSDGVLRRGKTVLSSERIRALICRTLMDFDCAATETIVACGPFSADPHERGCGPLYAGQPIVIDIFPGAAGFGYRGDMTRTVCRGPAPAQLKKMAAAVKAAQTAAKKKIRAGVRADEVHRAAAEELQRRGFQTGLVNGIPQGFIHGTGHGIGLAVHEAPRISGAVRRTLKTGHVVTVEPGLYYPDIGGVRIEDIAVVTDTGCNILEPISLPFEIG